MSRYTISIVTFSELAHAKRCIASVFDSSSDFELILTANGNPVAANYFHCIARDNKNVTVVVNQKNEGFIIPSNRALTLSTTPLIVFLNDDTVTSPGWLQALERPFNEFPTCALSGPVGGHFRASRNPDKAAVEYIFGWCMMGRTALLKKVGLFSDYLTGSYFEEIDLGLRLLSLGYTLHVASDCKVSHVGKATSSKLPGIKAIEQRNLREVVKRFPQYFGR